MAFLDNSGDIILDAVLTDAGRKRLAAGDGSFKIVKFSCGDDEIDYALYDKTNASGSAYFDLELLTTPILEAFTNNQISLKNKLISYVKQDLLYLPTLKANFSKGCGSETAVALTVDARTEGLDGSATLDLSLPEILRGFKPEQSPKPIWIDQGLDTTELDSSLTLQDFSADLVENKYIIEMDNRFCKLATPDAKASQVAPNYIDDDNIASYYVTLAEQEKGFVVLSQAQNQTDPSEVIAGPKGTSLKFKLKASPDVQQSTYLFTTLGRVEDIDGMNFYLIETVIRVVGVETGCSLDIPLKLVKKV